MDPKVKELLERIKDTTTTAGGVAYHSLDVAGKKVGEFWDIAKLKWARTELKTDVSRILREVGEIVYAAHSSPDEATQDEELTALLKELDEKYATIGELSQRIDGKRQVHSCPNENCRAPVSSSDAFCRRCGASLRETQDS